MDIACIQHPSRGGEKYWILFVDAYIGCCISRFASKKSDLADIGLMLYQDLQREGIPVKTIAGENTDLEIKCKKAGQYIKFEYTAPGAPQQNGVVERKFATLFGRVRAMNTGAAFSTQGRML
jgi:transposase InsO family protein